MCAIDIFGETSNSNNLNDALERMRESLETIPPDKIADGKFALILFTLHEDLTEPDGSYVQVFSDISGDKIQDMLETMLDRLRFSRSKLDLSDGMTILQ